MDARRREGRRSPRPFRRDLSRQRFLGLAAERVGAPGASGVPTAAHKMDPATGGRPFGGVMSDSDQRPRILYTAEATVKGGRRGHGVTSDGVVEVDFTSPKELGGDGARGTNPEQLFALGFAACWENAMLGIARRKGLDVEDAVVTAKVGIGRIESGRLGLAVELVITLPSLPDRAAAQALIDEAEQRCPYSNAVRGNIEVTLTLL